MKNVYNYHIREKNLTCTSKQTAVQTRRCLSALLDRQLLYATASHFFDRMRNSKKRKWHEKAFFYAE